MATARPGSQLDRDGSSAARALNRRLLDQGDIGSILTLFQRCEPGFNAVNISTALHRIDCRKMTAPGYEGLAARYAPLTDEQRAMLPPDLRGRPEEALRTAFAAAASSSNNEAAVGLLFTHEASNASNVSR